MKIYLKHAWLLILVAACGISKKGIDYSEKPPDPSGIWSVSYMKDQPGMETQSNWWDKAFIEINTSEEKISGSSGCNQFFGSFKILNGSVAVGPLASTKKYCMDVPEAEFFDALEGSNKYRIEGNTLILLKDEVIYLKFERKPEH